MIDPLECPIHGRQYLDESWCCWKCEEAPEDTASDPVVVWDGSYPCPCPDGCNGCNMPITTPEKPAGAFRRDYCLAGTGKWEKLPCVFPNCFCCP